MRWPLCLLLAAALAGCADEPCGGAPPPHDVPADHALLNPDAPGMKVVPPDSFDVLMETTKGNVTVRIYRDWAPMGVYRFYNLARNGFYDGSRFFRVLPGFVAQFGLSGRPQIDQLWNDAPMPDDPRRADNRGGTLTYARAGADTRTTQLFFNFADNRALDDQDFAPIGRVTQGMGVLFLLYSGYGETSPAGTGPAFHCVLSHGNRYLARRYPALDYIERLTVLE